MNLKNACPIVFALSLAFVPLKLAAQEKVAEETKFFAVPENDAVVLLQFIQQTQQAAVPKELYRDPKKLTSYQREKFEAILEACDRIEKQSPKDANRSEVITARLSSLQELSRNGKPNEEKLIALLDRLSKDQRPDVQRLVAEIRIKNSVRRLGSLPLPQRQQFVSELFSYIDNFGFDDSIVSSCNVAMATLKSSDNVENIGLLTSLLERLILEHKNELKTRRDPMKSGKVREYERMVKRIEWLGKPMEFTGTAVDGESFDMAKQRGKLVVVVFWSRYTSAERIFKKLEALLNEHGQQELAVVGILANYGAQDRLDALKEVKFSWPTVVDHTPESNDSERCLHCRYGIASVAGGSISSEQAVFLVDRQGKIVSTQVNEYGLEGMLKKHLSSSK